MSKKLTVQEVSKRMDQLITQRMEETGQDYQETSRQMMFQLREYMEAKKNLKKS